MHVVFNSCNPVFIDVGQRLGRDAYYKYFIQFGLKGGHFFPVIFAGVCLGYGLAMLFFGQQGDSHVVFAAAIVTSTLLGGIMKKPLAVTMLLFLCFPVKIFIWIFIAAAVGSKCVKKMGKEV